MKIKILRKLISISLCCLLWIATTINFPVHAAKLDILPSWQEGDTKNTIIDFVTDVTNPKSNNFVQIKDRIAVFDNDGTLWSEYPEAPPLTFIKNHGKGKGETTDAYIEAARQFVTTENNTEFGKPYVDLIYQPMVELLDYLRANGFQVYICDGGDIDFIRSFAEEYYDIPPQNVIGSTLRTKFDNQNYNPPALVRRGFPIFFKNKQKKPVSIQRYIGKKPIMAVGNSNSDLEMLQYTDDHQGHDLMMVVRHDDVVREHYEQALEDKKVNKILNEANAQGWSLISIKDDFKTVFPESQPVDSETFTLQLLHSSDFEAGLEALADAPRFSAVLNAIKDDYPNTLILSSGDNYIPSPFLFAGSDPSLNDTPVGDAGIGHADIEIHNQLGIQASTFGNHDFDLGTKEVQNIIEPSGAYRGTLFPYLSSNLDFSGDGDLSSQVTANGQELSTIPPGSLAGTAVITVNGEPIGIVGATTPLLPTIASSGNIQVSPENATDYDALAAKIQTAVDELTATGINKVILLAHMQQLTIERDELAPRLRDVDIIVAGGSHTLLSDNTDYLRYGDTSGGVYPILKTNADGKPIAIVNTAANFTYVGRLVVDFDENGILIPSSIDPNISGAYATDDTGVTAVGGTPDPEIVEITDALHAVIATQDGNIFGNTAVFLHGDRAFVRTEETNLGNLTADANLAYAQTVDKTTVISLKNGGSIRSNIGVISAADGGTDPDDFELLPPAANPEVGKLEGEVSQLDIKNSLRFNNGLTLFTITAEQLLQTIEHGVAGTTPGATPGQFPQIGGLKFSFDATLPVNQRVLSLVVVDNAGTIDVVAKNGELVGEPNRTFRGVALNYLVDGGDGYPLSSFLNANPILFNRIDLLGEPDSNGDGVLNPEEDLNKNGIRDAAFAEPFDGVANFTDFGSEQDALAEYFHQFFPTAENAFNQADTDPELDERIQNMAFREDTVIPD